MLMEVEEQAKHASEIILFVVNEKTRGVASMVEIGYMLGAVDACPSKHIPPVLLCEDSPALRLANLLHGCLCVSHVRMSATHTLAARSFWPAS